MPLEEKIIRQAAFAGYFLKKYRYSAMDHRGREQKRIVPLLIGRMPLISALPAADEDTDTDRQLLFAFLVVVVATLFGVIALALWFRFQDRRVQRSLDQATRREFVLPAPEIEGKIQGELVTHASPDTTDNWSGGSETPPTGETVLKLGGHNRLPDVPPS